MHEYSIVCSLIDSVEQTVRAHRGIKVHRLHVAIGELAGVDPALLRTAYETFREHSICADSALEIHHIAASWCCSKCREPLTQGEILRCPSCHRPGRLLAGDEILLQRVEMEVEHV